MADAFSVATEHDHPMRRELHGELHARPSLYFEGDTDVWHMAVVGTDGTTQLPANLLCLPAATKSMDGKHGIAPLGQGRVKWELHTEFLTLTYVGEASEDPFPPPAFSDLRNDVAGQTISAVRVVVREERDGAPFENPDPAFVASVVGGGDAEVLSNFKLNEAGFVEILLFNRGLNAYRAGRMVRRLLEIETYRMMALLALPVARATLAKLAQFDFRLDLVVEHMQVNSKVDKALLNEMTKLSSEVLKVSAGARHRFGATKAYSELVTSRLTEIREERVPQRQRMGTFIDRRFRPAVRSVEAAERRLDELGERVSLAGDLLRTTVQVQLEDQNAVLLSSMEERTRAQVHIQQAVEGFSVIAITYYAIGLVKTCIDTLPSLGVDPHIAKQILVLAIPVVLFTVWMVIRHVRRSVSKRPAIS